MSILSYFRFANDKLLTLFLKTCKKKIEKKEDGRNKGDGSDATSYKKSVLR